MKIFNHLFHSLINTFFSSATPNLFGSKKRRKEREDLSESFKTYASETQKEIDELKSKNPFESAAAKSAMAESSRKAKQIQQRFANTMGGNINPETLIASQQASQEAIAETAGDIATGSEANKAAQLAQLRGEKAAQLGQSAMIKQSAIDERGQGWKDFFGAFESVTSSLGNLSSGAGAAVGALV